MKTAGGGHPQKLTSATNSSDRLASAKNFRPPLSFLTLVWLSICTILFSRQNELTTIFFSFVSSFVLTAALSAGAGVVWLSLTKAQRVANRVTKNCVGVLSCVASLLVLCSANEITSNASAGIFATTSAEFTALSILTGYLGFDLWYSTLCDPLAQIVSIWEEAVTLTTFLVVLVKEGGNGVTRFRGHIMLWVGYKVLRLVLDLSRRGVAPVESIPPPSAIETAPSKSQSAESVNQENLWTVHGLDYDLREFVDRHPGGKEAIELGRGRDCTAMFESYHPFTEQHRIVLKKYRVGGGDSQEKKDLDPFYEVLKKRVGDTLKENGLDPNLDRTATPTRAAYYMFILACLVTAASYHVRGSIMGSFLFAVLGWLIGALGHDGGHFAVSHRPFINDVSVWGISLLCNPMMWQHQHTYAHHSHTNDFDQDPDLHHFEVLLRVHHRLKHHRIYGLQRNPFFVFFAYAFVVFGTCIKIPLGMIKTGTLYGMVEWTDRKRPLRAFMMLAHYAAYIFIIIVAPFASDIPWYVSLMCAVTHIVTAGMLFAIFSQINHLNEHSIETDGSCDLVKTSWAARQVVTSNNFATSSCVWHIISNGLNLQIEHHLFPGLNHTHLHLIAPIVRQTCEDYAVCYKSFETWNELMSATLRWLDALSFDDNVKVKSL